eukprot:855617_1
MVLDGPVLMLVDDTITNTAILNQEQCIIKHSVISLDSTTHLGDFYIPDVYSIQFSLKMTWGAIQSAMGMTFALLTLRHGSYDYFAFKIYNNRILIELNLVIWGKTFYMVTKP